jgi:hypothetical protein
MNPRPRHQTRVFLGCLILGLIGPTLSSPAAQAQQAFQTQWAAIYYEDPASLREMERRLHFSQAPKFSQSYFYAQDPFQAALSPGLAAKIDGLLAKVCLILRKRPQKGQELRIVILKDGKQVQQLHSAFHPAQTTGPSWFGYGRLEGFYESRSRTIFLSLDDLHEGILAHEMAHFVLCEAYTVPPPESVQEDWARHVESSLD